MWLPEFAWVLELARRGVLPSDEAVERARFVKDWQGLSAADRLRRFNGLVLDDPAEGRIEGDALAALVERGAGGRELQAAADTAGATGPSPAAEPAATKWVAATVTSGRAAGELVVRLAGAREPVELPVAVVADLRGDAPQLRAYYTMWPLRGAHTVRPPILPGSDEHPEGWPARYHRALEAGDVQSMLEAFEPDGVFREPAGARFDYRGREELAALFGRFFTAGGIILEHTAVTDDGRRCVLEYNALRWGSTDLPPQAGVGVYERGDSGRLRAARVYDDVEPPAAVSG